MPSARIRAAASPSPHQWSHLVRGAKVDDSYLSPYSGIGTVPAAFAQSASGASLPVAAALISTLGLDLGMASLSLPAQARARSQTCSQ